MKATDKIYLPAVEPRITGYAGIAWTDAEEMTKPIEYIRKDALLEWVKLAYGKVSMNPFDCSEAFEELIDKINSL